MTLNKINCWEYMKCGREPGGQKACELGICPAAIDASFDGLNLGKNAGRTCWLVAGTFCNEEAQGAFVKKQKSCKDCTFYRQVHAEEEMADLKIGTINIVALTHTGLVLKSNEDRYFIKKLADDSILLAVADGLGGEVAGDYAAEIMISRLAGINRIDSGNEIEKLALLSREADLAIADIKEEDPNLEGMGTTLVCVLLRNGVAYWSHVGDSRLYLLRDKQLLQITEDQTLARFLLKEGEITSEQVLTHYSRHVMDQCIGCGYCEPETGQFSVREKDLLILATDGAHQKVTTETLLSFLSGKTDIETKARSLVDAALEAGGKDNITLVVAQI